MPFQAISREVDQLYNVSTRLEGLAEQHPPVSEALIGIVQIAHHRAAPRGRQSFFASTSCSIVLSKLNSATSRFSRAFSSLELLELAKLVGL